jgi:hypothetical protein
LYSASNVSVIIEEGSYGWNVKERDVWNILFREPQRNGQLGRRGWRQELVWRIFTASVNLWIAYRNEIS